MQNLMVLGANTLQLPLIQEVKKCGYNVVVVSPRKNEPGFIFADYHVYADVRDERKVLKYAKKYNVKGVLTDQTDIPVRTAAYVTEEMGLPSIGYKTACLFTDKYLMREKCEKIGIPTLKYKKVNNIHDALDFFKTLKGKAIIKPIDNQGSKGVAIVETEKDIMDKLEESISYSNEKSVIIEQFITGEEYVVEGLIYNHKFTNLVCGEYNHFNLPGVFSSAATMYPVIGKDALIKRIEEINEKIITGFGLNNARTHSEFIVDKDKNIYLIETAARGGGVFISSDIVPLTTGINNEQLLINLATNSQTSFPKIEKKNIYCCCLAFYLPVGEIISLENIYKIKKMNFTHRNNLDNLHMGMKTKPYTDKTGRYFIIVSGKTYEQLINNIDFIRTNLKVEVMTDMDIKGPIWG